MLQHESSEPTEDTSNPTPLLELPDLSTLDGQLEESLRLFSNCDPQSDQAAIASVFLEEPFDQDGAKDACPWNQCCPDWDGPVLKLIDWKQAEEAYKNRIARHTTDERRVTAVMELLRSRGEYRLLQTIAPKWQAQLDMLERTFPNFAEVVEYLRAMFALAAHGDGAPRLAPMLLNGAPGCGKSYFSEHFANLFGSGYYCVHFETAQSNSGLTGSADYWNNSKPGEVFNVLVENDYANAFILVDEIDKVLTHEYDPLASLYGLLEPGTAKSYRDLSYPWLPPLDASRIYWVATANEADILPPPILDRFRRFNIPAPTEKEARVLIRNIFNELLEEMPPALQSMQLASTSVDMLSGCSPRRVKTLLREGLGRAVYDKCRRVAPKHLAVQPESGPDNRTIGFL